MNDLKAAAERLMKRPCTCYRFGGQPHDKNCPNKDPDLKAVAEAYLAEHDDRAIDEAWLREIGFDHPNSQATAVFDFRLDANRALRWRRHNTVWLKDYSRAREVMLVDNPTRGQLLQLLSALGVNDAR